MKEFVVRRTPHAYALLLTWVALLAYSVPARASSSLLHSLVPDARLNGVAGSGVADPGDPGTVWINPANGGRLRGLYGSGFGGELYGRSQDLEYYGGYLSGGGDVYHHGSFGLGLGGEVRHQWLDNIETGTPTTVSRYTSLAAGVDFMFSNELHISAGMAYKMSQQDDPYEADGTLYDFGVSAGVDTTWASGWHLDAAFAYSYRNKRETSGQVSLGVPELSTVGFSLGISGPTRKLFDTDVPALSLRLNLDRQKAQRYSASTQYAAGLEIGLWQVGWFRIGSAKVTSVGFGLGLRRHNLLFRLDYASLDSSSWQDSRDKFGVLLGWVW